MRKRFLVTLSIMLAFSLVAAACGDDETTATTSAGSDTTEAPDTTDSTEATDSTEGSDTTEAMADVTPVKACVVTDLAGVDDRSFNASAWQGVQNAVDAGYATADSFFLESADASDWQPNVDQFVSQGCEHIVTVGFALGETTAINAPQNPDISWTMIDNVLTDADFAPLGLTNVRELVYQTDEAAFAAGYLAAGVSSTGVLCTYGGANFPTVSIFMDGFTRGAMHYNDIKGTDVQVLGWDPDAGDGTFTGSFTDMGLARSTADSFFQENCDMILPVGGAINLPAGDGINEGSLDAALIGVDVDAFEAMDAQYQDLWLTTIEKNMVDGVTQSIKEHAEGTWAPGATVGNLANEGVGLSDYHSWDDRVSDELRAEVTQLLEDIKSGTVKADFTAVGY